MMFYGRLDMKNFLVGPHTIHVQNYDKEPQVGNVTIGLSNLTVENINTFSKLKAFDTFDKQPTRWIQKLECTKSQYSIANISRCYIKSKTFAYK